MANQTLAAVPPDVSDPRVLSRFLSRLLEDLDTVLGNRSNQTYVSQEDLLAEAESLQVRLTEAATVLDETIVLTEQLLVDLDDTYESRFAALEDKNTQQDQAIISVTNYAALKGAMLDFTVNVYDDGGTEITEIIHYTTYNINTIASTKVNKGLYEFELAQASFFGFTVLDNSVASVSSNIASSATTNAFHVSLVTSGVPAGKFRIKVQQATIVLDELVYADYDLVFGDRIQSINMFSAPNAGLPPL